MFNYFFLLCQVEIHVLQCSPHPLSYPVESLFICIFESIVSLNFISNDFKVRGSTKKNCSFIWGLLSSWCIHWRRPIAKMLAKTALYSCQCLPAENIIPSQRPAIQIWSQTAMSPLSFPTCIMLCIWNQDLRYFIHLLSPKDA